MTKNTHCPLCHWWRVEKTPRSPDGAKCMGYADCIIMEDEDEVDEVEKKPQQANEAASNPRLDGDDSVIGYMCRIDWECEIGQASDGNKIYPSIDDLKRHHDCAEQCGIVEVQVSLLRIVEPGTEL